MRICKQQFLGKILPGLYLFILFSCSNDVPINIGVIISSTGSGAHMSEAIDGIKLAADEINKWGGINGRPVNLIIRDNETNPDKAVEIFNELEKEYKPDIYFCALSPVALALAPLAEENKAPLICLLTTNTEITKNSEWVFRFSFSADQEIPPILQFIDTYNMHEVAVIYRNDEFGEFILTRFQEAIQKKSVIEKDYPFDPEAPELSASIAGIQDSDSVYIIGYGTDIDNILIELRAADYKGKIMASSGASQLQVKDLPEAEGVMTAAPFIYNRNFLMAKELREKFEHIYNRPLNHYGASGYESLKIIASLMEDHDFDREMLRKHLEGGFMYSGSLGNISAKQGVHDFDFDLLPAIIKNGNINYE